MRKPHGVSPTRTRTRAPAYVQRELEPELVAWRACGLWSAYGIDESAQARPITMYADTVFYLQTPQPWVTQELFTDEAIYRDDLYGKA